MSLSWEDDMIKTISVVSNRKRGLLGRDRPHACTWLLRPTVANKVCEFLKISQLCRYSLQKKKIV